MSNPATIAEHRDTLEHLAAQGYAPLLEVLQDPSCWTKGERGRERKLVLSQIARLLNVSRERAAAMLRSARASLAALE